MKAFPSIHYDQQIISKNGNTVIPVSDGMDLRDYFAAKAMQLTYTFWTKDYYELELDDEEVKTGFLKDMTLIAETAYEMADAMMEARNAK